MVEVALAEGKRLVDTQSGPPQQDDQRTPAEAIGAVDAGAHHGDDLLDQGWVGGIADAFVARLASGVESRHRGRRRTTTGGIEQQLGHTCSLRTSSESRSRDRCSLREEAASRTSIA
jgi:hypothetical protein